jgi:hypothetical protein
MSAGIYANVNGVTRKGKKLYAKVNGVVRPIKELWVKDNGVARCVYRAMPQIIDVEIGTMDECNITYNDGIFTLALKRSGSEWNPTHIVYLQVKYDRPFTVKQATVCADYYNYEQNRGLIQNIRLFPYGDTGYSNDSVEVCISDAAESDGMVSKTKDFANVTYNNSNYVCIKVNNDDWEGSIKGRIAGLKVYGYIDTVEYGRIYV